MWIVQYICTTHEEQLYNCIKHNRYMKGSMKIADQVATKLTYLM